MWPKSSKEQLISDSINDIKNFLFSNKKIVYCYEMLIINKLDEEKMDYFLI
jgi:hypothetical protein